MSRRLFRIAVATMACTVLVTFGLTAPSAQNPAATETTEQVKERWDKQFAGDLRNLNREPSALLVSAIAGRKPGKALDLGTGQGRNAIYLAERGWTVTGVDLSDVAIDHAKKNAAARNVHIDAIVGDLDVFDFGKEQWDLIASFYMHSWHDRSKTDVAARIYEALKPGGLVVMEGFARPEVPFGFDAGQLRQAFGRFRVLRSESVMDKADWDKNNSRHIVRFVAEKI
jgi:SAM-dependent methyltransferase